MHRKSYSIVYIYEMNTYNFNNALSYINHNFIVSYCN